MVVVGEGVGVGVGVGVAVGVAVGVVVVVAVIISAASGRGSDGQALHLLPRVQPGRKWE